MAEPATPALTLDLAPYLAKIAAANAGLTLKEQLVKFYISEDLVGYCLPEFAEKLQTFTETFEAAQGGGLQLKTSLATPEQRSQALAGVFASLRAGGLIEGWRDELYPVTTGFHAEPLCTVERAAAVYLGIKSYGVHVNGYVVRPDGGLDLWVGRRSASKSTWPGRLDHIVAGGQPSGMSCRANVVKECGEEASVPPALAATARAGGVVGCEQMQRLGLKRDVLFVYDLLLPTDFTPAPQDGEVEEFMLMAVEEVAAVMATTGRFKPNVELVILDFMVRRGYFDPDMPGYCQLLAGLRSGDVS